MTFRPGTHQVVVDASLVAMWVLQESYSTRARILAREWSSTGFWAIAPCFLMAEVTNALYKRTRRGELPIDHLRDLLDAVDAFAIRLEEEPKLHRTAIDLAHRLNRPSSYDSHYLALAQMRGCAMWTGDERLYNAVREQIPWLHWIGAYQPAGG